MPKLAIFLLAITAAVAVVTAARAADADSVLGRGAPEGAAAGPAEPFYVHA